MLEFLFLNLLFVCARKQNYPASLSVLYLRVRVGSIRPVALEYVSSRAHPIQSFSNRQSMTQVPSCA